MGNLESKLKGIWQNVKKKAMPIALAGAVAGGSLYMAGCDQLNKLLGVEENTGTISVYSIKEGAGTSAYSNSISNVSSLVQNLGCDESYMTLSSIEINDGLEWMSILDEDKNICVSNEFKPICLEKKVPSGQYHAIRIKIKPDLRVKKVAGIECDYTINGLPEQLSPNGNADTITLNVAEGTLDAFDVEKKFNTYLFFDVGNAVGTTWLLDIIGNPESLESVDSWKDFGMSVRVSRYLPE